MAGIFESLVGMVGTKPKKVAAQDKVASALVDEIIRDYSGMTAEASVDEFKSVLFPSIKPTVESRLAALEPAAQKTALRDVFSGLVKKAQETTETSVVFRKWIDSGDIIAIFPELTEESGMVMMYEHVGQHGNGHYDIVEEQTTEATHAEYADLKAELEGLGYRFTSVRTAQVIDDSGIDLKDNILGINIGLGDYAVHSDGTTREILDLSNGVGVGSVLADGSWVDEDTWQKTAQTSPEGYVYTNGGSFTTAVITVESGGESDLTNAVRLFEDAGMDVYNVSASTFTAEFQGSLQEFTDVLDAKVVPYLGSIEMSAQTETMSRVAQVGQFEEEFEDNSPEVEFDLDDMTSVVADGIKHVLKTKGVPFHDVVAGRADYSDYGLDEAGRASVEQWGTIYLGASNDDGYGTFKYVGDAWETDSGRYVMAEGNEFYVEWIDATKKAQADKLIINGVEHVTCPMCKGDGVLERNMNWSCPRCLGTGIVPKPKTAVAARVDFFDGDIPTGGEPEYFNSVDEANAYAEKLNRQFSHAGTKYRAVVKVIDGKTAAVGGESTPQWLPFVGTPNSFYCFPATFYRPDGNLPLIVKGLPHGQAQYYGNLDEDSWQYQAFEFTWVIEADNGRIVAKPYDEWVKTAQSKHYCPYCGKDMGDEWLLGETCGTCTKKHHRSVTKGDKALKRQYDPSTGKKTAQVEFPVVTLPHNYKMQFDPTTNSGSVFRIDPVTLDSIVVADIIDGTVNEGVSRELTEDVVRSAFSIMRALREPFKTAQSTPKGLLVDIMGRDATNGGVTSGQTQALLVSGRAGQVAEVFEANGLPVLTLDFNGAGQPYAAKPIGGGSGLGPMMGGHFIWSSDSRFPSNAPIPVHDRYETSEQYRALSASKTAGILDDIVGWFKGLFGQREDAINELESVVNQMKTAKKSRFRTAQTDADPATSALVKEWLLLKEEEKAVKKKLEACRPDLVEAFKTADSQQLRVDGILYTALGTKTSPSYKGAFELALTKVNAATRAILEQAKAATMSTCEVLNVRPVKP